MRYWVLVPPTPRRFSALALANLGKTLLMQMPRSTLRQPRRSDRLGATRLQWRLLWVHVNRSIGRLAFYTFLRRSQPPL